MAYFETHPTITSTITGKVYPDNRQGREQMDRDEGRVRMPNSGLEAMVGMEAALYVLDKNSKTIKPFIDKTGAGKMLRMYVGGIRKSLGEITRKLSVGQNVSLQKNTQMTTITVSSGKVPAMLNISADDLSHICNRALEMCAFSCACTREESKNCRLRHAYEQVASASVEAVREDPTKCPYAGLSLEVDGDE